MISSLSTMNSSRNDTESEQWYDIYEKIVTLATVLYVIIFIVGMLGNCSVFLTIACNRSMRQGKKAPNILLAGLALSDCIYLLVNTPLRICEKVFAKNLGTNEFLCGFFSSIGVFSQGISVFSLVILSYDRYKAILSPLQHRQWQTAKTYYSMVVISWSLAIAFAVTAGCLSYHDIYPLELDNGTVYVYVVCEPLLSFSTQAKIFESTKAIMLFLFPMNIIAFCYISISCHLCSTGRLVKNETENKKIKEQRVRLAAIIAAMAVAFFICWFPYIVWHLLYQFNYNIDSAETAIAGVITPVLACANSCINPVIMYLISREFRSYICGYKLGQHRNATTSVVGSSRFVRLSRGSTIVSSVRDESPRLIENIRTDNDIITDNM